MIIDSGKDQWEGDAHGLEFDFIDLAEKPPDRCPRTRGHCGSGAAAFRSALPRRRRRRHGPRVLGRRTRIHPRPACRGQRHPRSAGLNPVLVFQELDASDTERRRQRNRIHFELAVPSDLAQICLATTVAAGGRLLDESEDRWRVADPEGNEMVIVSGA